MYDEVLLVCTDAASYKVRAMEGLQVLYSKMIHMTCLAHGLHRVAEMVRTSYPDINRFISLCKSIFLKAPHRVQKFRDCCRYAIAPSPVITRCGTWLEASKYSFYYFEVVYSVVMDLNPSSASNIKVCLIVLF